MYVWGIRSDASTTDWPVSGGAVASVFLSYRSGDDGGYAETLLEDVLSTVRGAGHGDTGIEGFRSAGDWTAGTIDALGRSTVFLAICSDRYRLTERCGREWQAFLDRLKRHESATGRRRRALIPVRWGAAINAGEMPGAGFVDPVALGDDARALARLSANRSGYRRLVRQIAGRAVEVSAADPVQPATGLVSYPTTRNAFHPAVSTAAPEVRFLVPGGERSAMATVAQAVATEQRYRSEVVDDPDRIHQLLDPARPETGVVMLLDAWGVRRAEYRDVWAAAVIPLGEARPSTGPECLSAEVGEVLEAARNLSFRFAAVRRTAPGRTVVSRPILDSP
ncbi:MAG: toll/interleukin-1 receptor domain-containing protein [Actinoplanes sp.]